MGKGLPKKSSFEGMTKEKAKIAEEMAYTVPTFLRHMYPYILQPNKLPPSQLLAVVAIYEQEGITIGHLSRALHVSAPTASGIVQRLRKGGFIRLGSDPKDKRVKKLFITKRGIQAVINFRAIIRQRWKYILSRLTSKEALDVIRILKRLTQGFCDGTL